MGARDLLAAGAGTLIVALTGCGGGGGGGGGSDVTKVKETLRRELAALANGDGATVCSLATASGRTKLENAVPGASCEHVVQLVTQRLPEPVKEGLRTAKIGRVAISGKTATVQDSDITSSKGSLAGFLQPGPGSAPTVLTKQPDGSWKISG
jgi:hypothetical protein